MMETQPQEKMITPPAESVPSNGHDTAPPKRVRRDFTTEEKVILVGKHLKSGLSFPLSAKALGVHDSVLRRWVATYGIPKASTKKAEARMRFTAAAKVKAIANLKPGEEHVLARAKKLGLNRSTLYSWMKAAKDRKPAQAPKSASGYTDEQKIKALERWERGADIKALAAKMSVHQDSIRGWWKKFRKGSSPRSGAVKKAATGNGTGTPKRKFDYAFRKAAVDRLEHEKRVDVQSELGIPSGMMTNWIKAVAAADKKILRAEKSAAKLAEREHRDVVAIETVHAMPESRSLHDTIVYLRHARDEANKLVRAGRASVDDPIVLYSMLALNASGGGHR